MKLAVFPGKVTTGPAAVAVDANRFMSLAGAGFTTEMADPKRAAALQVKGCTVTHDGGPGKGECAIITRDSRWTVKEQHWFKLTEGGGKARLHNPIYAVAAVLERPGGRTIVLTGVHLPAHVETRWRLIPLPARLKARVLARRSSVVGTYAKALVEWRKRTMALAAKVKADDIVAPADFNLNAHAGWVQALFAEAWPELHIRASLHPDLGNRTVGFVLTTMRKKSAQVLTAHASDHNAGLYDLERIPDPPPAPPKPPKPPVGDGTPKVNEAIAAAKKQSATGVPHHGPGECLMAVRECYGFPAVQPDAIASWNVSAHKHRTTDPNSIPRGVPVYWSGGSSGHGHIAISNGDGTCWSTDIRRIGFFDRTEISQIHTQWGLTLLGWSEEVNGFHVPDINTKENK